MRTPDRILRADAEDLEREPPALTQREQEQYTRILAIAEGIMARRGTHTMTASGLAQALHMGAATLRRHFADLDVLLATLVSRHLRKIGRALREVPQEAPDRPQKLRAAYLAYTRTNPGSLTDAHLLLVRDRHLLPEDLLTHIEVIRRGLGDTLAPGHAEAALGLLDLPCLDAPRIEAAFAAVTAAAEQPKPASPAPIAAPLRRDRATSAAPPWAPRGNVDLLRFGPLPVVPHHATFCPQIHSSA
jgi:AcrR family transcriptional regulator